MYGASQQRATAIRGPKGITITNMGALGNFGIPYNLLVQTSNNKGIGYYEEGLRGLCIAFRTVANLKAALLLKGCRAQVRGDTTM